MKISLLITVVIIGLASFFGTQRSLKIQKLTTTWESLKQEGEELEIPTDPKKTFSASRSRSISERAAREEKVRDFATYLTDFAVKMKKAEEKGDVDESQFSKEIAEIIGTLTNMPTSDLRSLVKILSADDSVDQETKKQLVSFAIMMMASDNPEAALALSLQARESLEIKGLESDQILQVTINQYAAKDPVAAAQWLVDNKDKLGKMNEGVSRMIIAQAATKDFKVAIGLIDTLKLNESHSPYTTLAQSVTPDRADDLLAALKEKGVEPETRKQVIGQMANRSFLADFEAASTWIKEADLNGEERAAFTKSIGYWSAKQNVVQWMDWISTQEGNSETEITARQNATNDLIRGWAREDFAATAEWINKQPEGSSKNDAVLTYAKTISKHEPAAAADWADTLPDSDDKTKLLGNIHNHLKADDPEAAKTFAEKHGIKEASSEE